MCSPEKKHSYVVGPEDFSSDTDPGEEDAAKEHRPKIEPWLSAVFQSEHLSLLVGNGLTSAVTDAAGVAPPSMDRAEFPEDIADFIDAAAERDSEATGRGTPNIEDQLRSAIRLAEGLTVLQDDRKDTCWDGINSVMSEFLQKILVAEEDLRKRVESSDEEGTAANRQLCLFLLSFASRAATRERVQFFTTNYDRVLEYGCDWVGLRVIDRFVGVLSPIYRATRVDVDMHYNPPGIRGEPRYLEGVVKLTKLHGSVDWRYQDGILRRVPLPFGASSTHPAMPAKPADTVIIYPNPAKDVETSEYPYAELFRDFSAALCQPNSALVTYGYGFGDDHVNRVLLDMLALPSTHLVIISYDDAAGRIAGFRKKAGHDAQISLLLGPHFGALGNLVDYYLPKPAIDQISFRRAKLLENRGQRPSSGDANGTGFTW